MSVSPTQVLVTGGSGFIAATREAAVRESLRHAGMTRGHALSVVEADLEARRVPRWRPRPSADAVTACTRSLIDDEAVPHP